MLYVVFYRRCNLVDIVVWFFGDDYVIFSICGKSCFLILIKVVFIEYNEKILVSSLYWVRISIKL